MSELKLVVSISHSGVSAASWLTVACEPAYWID